MTLYRTITVRRLRSWLLLALLLCGQLSILVHESQHEFSLTDNYCVVCHTAQQLHGACPSAIVSFESRAEPERLTSATHVITPTVHLLSPASPRAPPRLS